MIELIGVSKTYRVGTGERSIFKDIDTILPTDERVVILGGKDSGKSTLVRLLAGLERPTSGAIRRYAKLSFPAGHTRGLKLNLSGRQNLIFVASIYGADPDEVCEFVSSTTGLGHAMEEPLRKLPMPERLSFCYALTYAIPFDTYLFDNAIVWGTPEFRRRCQAMFEARSEASGMIVATGNVKLAKEIGGVGGVLRDGALRMYPSVNDAVADYLADTPPGPSRAYEAAERTK